MRPRRSDRRPSRERTPWCGKLTTKRPAGCQTRGARPREGRMATKGSPCWRAWSRLAQARIHETWWPVPSSRLGRRRRRRARGLRPPFRALAAERIEMGLRYSLVFGFLTRNLHFASPAFVQPGSHPFLELADFVSYATARYIDRRLRGARIDLDPAEWGEATYAAFDASGALQFCRSSSYPWDLLFGSVPPSGQ